AFARATRAQSLQIAPAWSPNATSNVGRSHDQCLVDATAAALSHRAHPHVPLVPMEFLMPTSVSPRTASSASLARNRLGVTAVIMFAMTAATPLLVVGALVVTAWAGTGVVGMPLAFVLIGIVLAIFAAGYVAMARHVVNAGAFYSYIALGANKA